MQRLPTWVEVNLDVLANNIESIRRAVTGDVGVLLTVKADAYGHGAVEIAQAAEPTVERFGVATVDEAIELATAGIQKKILILSPILEEEIPAVVERGFAATASSLDFAKAISDHASSKKTTAEVHIEIDTGMGRAGVLPAEVDGLLGRIAKLKALRLGGVFTHFPVSDTDPGFTRNQVREFEEAIARVRSSGITVPTLHSANSAAIPSVPESHMGMVRPGLLAYGHHPGGMATGLEVEPVLSWKCRIAQVREVPAGTSVSYDRTFTTKRPTTMAVLPVGYGHGYPFRLSNRGEVVVHGARVPIIGRVTMDMTMVDVTDVKPKTRSGDEVVLIGRQGDCEVGVDEIASWAGTISYEILTGIGKRVSRAYIRDGKVQAHKSLLGVVPAN